MQSNNNTLTLNSARNSMEITSELLLKNGFHCNPLNIYTKSIPNKAVIALYKDEEGLNSGRMWDCHIDNAECMTIGNVEIDTTEHLRYVCNLYDIDFKQLLGCPNKCKKCEWADTHITGELFCIKSYMYKGDDDWYFDCSCPNYKRERLCGLFSWVKLKLLQFKRKL